MSTSKRSQATVVDLFCGVGGLSLGFKKQGFDVVAGIDVDDSGRYAFEKYTSGKFLHEDVEELEPDDVAKLFGKKGPRILIGCAPCRTFSEYNKKRRGRSWNLLPAFAKIIEGVQPDVVSMENVAALEDYKGGRVLRTFVNRLSTAGYDVAWHRVSCADYGISQRRNRLILFASKYGFVDLVEPTRRDTPTLRDVIKGLPVLQAGGTDRNDPYHRAPKLSERNLQRMEHSEPGGTWRDWPASLMVDCHRSTAGAEFGSVYGRLSWDKIGPTVTTQFFKVGTGRFGHPSQRRALSLREGALLQTFPRNFEFVGPDDTIKFEHVGRMIGNAVPVKLAEVVAKSIARHLEEHI